MNARNLFVNLAATSMLLTACEKKDAELPATTTATATAEQKAVPATDTAAQAEEQASGQWVKSEKYKVKFRVPEDWEIKSTDEAASATSPDDTITVILVGTESEGVFEAAMSSITKQVQIKDIKTESSKMTVVNGFGGFHGRGSAVLVTPNGDQEVQFLGYALRLDAETAVAVMVFAEAEMYEARKEEIESIGRSIQKL